MLSSRGLLLLLFAFSFLTAPALSAAEKDEAPICLTDCSKIPSEIEAYAKKRPLKTEMDEINYLLHRIRTSKLKFIRNGSEYDSFKAAVFLRSKIGWYQMHRGEKIDNDEKFVAKVLKGSETTGEPYRVVFPDGKKLNLQQVMFHELNYLEAYQGETPELSAKDLRFR